MNDTPLFAGMTPEEIQEFERSTGLQMSNEADWSDSDVGRVIAFLRDKAVRRTIFQIQPRCTCSSSPAWFRRSHSSGKLLIAAG
jgi:hypothetical protein